MLEDPTCFYLSPWESMHLNLPAKLIIEKAF